MSLTIVYGRSGTGKSEYCLDCAKSASEMGKKVLLIVPEQFSHVKETELIRKTGFISSDLKASSFKRLSYSVLNDAVGFKPVLDRTQKNMMIAKAIYSVKSELKVFDNIHKKLGFISVIQDMISEFKRSCITSGELEEYAKKTEDNGLLSAKLSEISLIYEKYQSLIDEKSIDDDDNLTLLAEEIARKNDMRETEVFIDEFFRFTIAELRCIEAFLKAGANVTVCLCMDAEGDLESGIFAPVRATYRTLLGLAKKAGVKINAPVILKEKHRFKESKELLWLESEYPTYKNNIYNEETRDISLFTASDLYSEVMNLASGIAKAVQKENVRYRDIAIICGDPENYSDIVKTVFEIQHSCFY